MSCTRAPNPHSGTIPRKPMRQARAPLSSLKPWFSRLRIILLLPPVRKAYRCRRTAGGVVPVAAGMLSRALAGACPARKDPSTTMTNPGAVFLDRDGVLNEVRMAGGVASGPRRVGELHIVPGARAGLLRLKAAGLTLIVVSNQPDVARGDLSAAALEEINQAL